MIYEVGEALVLALTGDVVLANSAYELIKDYLCAEIVPSNHPEDNAPANLLHEKCFHKLNGHHKIMDIPLSTSIVVDCMPRVESTLQDCKWASSHSNGPSANSQLSIDVNDAAITNREKESSFTLDSPFQRLSSSTRHSAAAMSQKIGIMAGDSFRVLNHSLHTMDGSNIDECTKVKVNNEENPSDTNLIGKVFQSAVQIKNLLNAAVSPSKAIGHIVIEDPFAEFVQDGRNSRASSITNSPLSSFDSSAKSKSVKLPARDLFMLMFAEGTKFAFDLSRIQAFLVDERDSLASPNQKIALLKGLQTLIHEVALSSMHRGSIMMLSEMRVVTTAFIEIVGLQDDLARGDNLRVQHAMSILMSTTKRHNGSLRQLIVDDKGFVAILCFGLTGSAAAASENNSAIRAIQSAQFVIKMLRSIQCKANIGIAQGLVFCGLVGALFRGEYAVMGSSVNRAARLMSAKLNHPSQETGNIIVDSEVYENSFRVIEFEEGPMLSLKGYSSPIPVIIAVKQNVQSLLCQQFFETGDGQ